MVFSFLFDHQESQFIPQWMYDTHSSDFYQPHPEPKPAIYHKVILAAVSHGYSMGLVQENHLGRTNSQSKQNQNSTTILALFVTRK